MEALYQYRQKKQIKHLMKYYRYVFNDHFTMVLFFSFGGFLYLYSELLKEMTAGMWRMIPFLLPFFYMGTLFFGRLATYIKKADSYYLLPKEKQMGQYFKKAFWHSMLLPVGVLLFALAVSYPLLKGSTDLPLIDLGSLFFLLISLKGITFLKEIQSHYQGKQSFKIVFSLFALGSIYISLRFCFVGMGIFGVLAFLFFYRQTFMTLTEKNLVWEKVIEKESQRMKKMYGFISLFTDVPEMPTQVKRRKVFDIFLNKIAFSKQEIYTHLFSRRLLRGQEFSSLFLSITTLAILVFVVFQQFIGNILASAFFIYLLGFQLLPLYHSFDYMMLTQLYPLSPKIKRQDFQKVLFVSLLIEAKIFIFVNFFFLTFIEWGILIGILLLEIFLFCYIYAPKRLQRAKH